MDSCCSSSSEKVTAKTRQAASCPCCGISAKRVERVTLMHQVVAPLNQQLPPDDFYFCRSTSCNTVYFSNGGAAIDASQIRAEVGHKSTQPGRVICYCFGISHSRIMAEIEKTGTCASRVFVMEQTKLKNCACDIRNPSGKCCLKEFPT
ncbi:MAG: hypothetical protein ACJAWL_002061 [Motiliproteus sp.]|jgi:hypothetical protein